MMQSVKRIDGRVLWANLFLLFWLSLFPFLIRWIGVVGVTALPVAAFGTILLLAGFGYYVLERELIAAEGAGSVVAQAVGSKRREWLSVAAYAAGAALAFVSPWISIALYVAVALLWLVPDRRFETRL